MNASSGSGEWPRVSVVGGMGGGTLKRCIGCILTSIEQRVQFKQNPSPERGAVEGCREASGVRGACSRFRTGATAAQAQQLCCPVVSHTQAQLSGPPFPINYAAALIIR